MDFNNDFLQMQVPSGNKPSLLSQDSLALNGAPTPAGSNGPDINTKIMGIPLANFTAMMGMLGQAVGGNTGGGRISAVASALGQTQLKAIAAQNQQKQQQQFLKELLGKGGDLNQLTPEQAKVLGLSPNLLLGNGPSGSTGLETGTITPAKLGDLNKPSLY